jgi:S1-C subfamily serine protease
VAPGQRVFAFGHPDDTSAGAVPGIVLEVTAEEVVTNVQFLPGHSGGPLVDAAGRVVGVSALKRVRADEDVYADGQGIAIPVAIALQDFPQLRTGTTRTVTKK